MKKVVISFLTLLVPILMSAQVVIFHENFEAPSYADSVTSSQTANNVDHWGISSMLYNSGGFSDSCPVIQNDTTYLTTNAFSTIGVTTVILEFDHICKIEFFDAAEIHVSNNNGLTWTKLTWAQYNGSGQFNAIGYKFASVSYSVWDPANNTAIPTNTWWKHETFNITSLVSNSSQVKIRFLLADLNNTGSAGNYGWLIDDIKVSNPNATISDAGVINILNPTNTSQIFSTVQVYVEIKNFGNIPLTSIPVKYQVNNNAIVSEIWTGNLLPDSSINYNFQTTFTAGWTNTSYDICSWTELLNDNQNLNDSSCKTITLLNSNYDVGISKIIEPSMDTLCYHPSFYEYTIKVRIKNFNIQPHSTIPVEYQVGSSVPVSEIWTGSILNSYDSIDYTFNTKYLSTTSGSFNICARTKLLDLDSTNNESCRTYITSPCTGLEENFIETTFEIYPNPSSGIITLIFDNNKEELFIRITNIYGQSIKKFYTNEVLNTIDFSQEPKGIYFINVNQNKKSLTRKVIIN
ncbi:MAG: T9SS type A sorting domain-containing protein [Saprospiraceae bacterium]|nr:T9SS type A sorting domain-containing protein [Saprospiraceae bacterium]